MSRNLFRLHSLNSHLKDDLLLFGKFNNLCSKAFNAGAEKEIIIPDAYDLKEKMKKMRRQGPENLQIVSDFDQTLTAFLRENGKRCPSAFSIFRSSLLTSSYFRQTLKDLYYTYSPVERDTTMDLKTKNKLFKEWQDKTEDLFLEEGFDKEKCLNIINDSLEIPFRYNFESFFKICAEVNLPFFLVSAGIKEVIVTIMNSVEDLNKYENFMIFSNEMIFKNNKNLKKFNFLATSTNKEDLLRGKGLSFKKNTLLFGDLASDYYMAKYVTNNESLLTVAFFDEIQSESLLPSYTENFDVVIRGDGHFILHEIMLRCVMGDEPNKALEEKARGLAQYKQFFDIYDDVLRT